MVARTDRDAISDVKNCAITCSGWTKREHMRVSVLETLRAPIFTPAAET